MNSVYEFFFCPIHGLLRPEMWQFVMPFIIENIGRLRWSISRISSK